jgi:HEAT repeat protein
MFWNDEISGCVMPTASHTPVLGYDLVETLAEPYRATAAYNRLLKLGDEALPAVQAGLRHSCPDVRFHCCRFLDRYLRPDIFRDLIAMLNDSDERVRVTTLHTLACDRCKEGSCRPEEACVLPPAMKMLASDPSAHVRAMAIEVIGQFVHSNPSVVETIEAAALSDKSSTVRKKPGWYAPGGTIYRRSLPNKRKRAVG